MGAIKCLKCKSVLESMHRHDFQMCDCENQSFVDGGTDYLRYGGMDMGLIKILPSCEVCGCSLENKSKIIYAFKGKPWEICKKCYEIMKGAEQ